MQYYIFIVIFCEKKNVKSLPAYSTTLNFLTILDFEFWKFCFSPGINSSHFSNLPNFQSPIKIVTGMILMK